MALTESSMLALGVKAPAFSLPDFAGQLHDLAEFQQSPALVVAFICNHCPYVKHVRLGFAQFAREYQARGVAVVGIMSNDLGSHPQDGPEGMRAEATEAGYTFPYLLDRTQDVARTFRAACTPDFYLFDKARQLVYRGQFDDSRPGNGKPVTGADLRAACDAVLSGRQAPAEQKPSVGCNIKWR
jgi:peroxiredoxin